MKSFTRDDISSIKMGTNPPQEIVNCGMKVINTSDKHIYEYVGICWIKTDKADKEDYREIPQLI
tara:strand:+ start:2512 stop:2703 length:192 start_codon:yes stop_codon:yes gene_type:complete